MRIRNLSSFVKVARLGSFRAASVQLHASQPAISARITALEDELGVQLFNRGKSGTHLTERGRMLLPYAEKLLAISQEMKAKVGQSQPEKGSLKIGIADTLAHLWLSPLLKQWQQQHPQISFELTSDVTPVLIKQLQQHQIDLTLMVAEQTNNSLLINEALCSYPQVWVAAQSIITPQANDVGVQWTIEAMVKQPILSFPRDTTPWHYLQHLFSQHSLDAVIHTCSSVASLINLAEQGLGIALLPLPLVEKQLEQGRLQSLETEVSAPSLDFSCCWRLDDERILPRLLAGSARDIMQL